MGIAAGLLFRGGEFFLPWLAVTVLFFPLFLFRMMGAGDVKLMALISGFSGWHQGFSIIFSGLFLAALASLFKLLYQGTLIRRISYFSAYIRQVFQTKTIIAYYEPERDGCENTLPMAVFFLAGALGHLLSGQ